MSTEETAPLNPSLAGDADPELDSLADNARDIPTLKNRCDPLYLLILYGSSSLISLGALSCAIWGYCIVKTAPFDDQSNDMEREGYEKHFWGMQSIVVLVFLTKHLTQSKFGWLINTYRIASISSGPVSTFISRSEAANKIPNCSGWSIWSMTSFSGRHSLRSEY